MNYPEAIDWLYATQGVGIKLGLENIERLLVRLGLPCYPHTSSPAPIVHVAGTNGKGSVCAMLDAICRAAGLRTGLFTSPHLVTYRERIRLNGRMIPEEAVARWLTQLRTLTTGPEWGEQQPPTFFELTTALAMAWFLEEGAEVLIVETGLGGRLDSSNALPPAVTLFTPISLDHHQYLGNTLRSIASEKAGIMKEGTPVASAPQPPEAAEVIESTARLLALDESFTWITEPLPPAQPLNLAGSHQRWNAALAVEGMRLLVGKLPPRLQARLAGHAMKRAISTGLRNVHWPGRFQRIRQANTGVEIILDGAHNIASAEQLLQTWSESYGEARPSLLLGALSDKDVSAIVRILAPLARRFLFVPVRNPRTSAPQALAELARQYAPEVPGTCYSSMEEALSSFVPEGSDDRLLITGSLFLVGDALALLEEAEQDPISLQ